MSHTRAIRQVLAELELISHGSTVRFDPTGTAGESGSRIPSGEANPPHLSFRAQFDECRTDRERVVMLERARTELESIKRGQRTESKPDGELLRLRILDAGEWDADEVARALYCSPRLVRKARVADGRDGQSGRRVELFAEDDRGRSGAAREARKLAPGEGPMMQRDLFKRWRKPAAPLPTTAAELARVLRQPTWLCSKCGSPMWYQQMLSSSVHVCENKDCAWLSFFPERDAVRADGR